LVEFEDVIKFYSALQKILDHEEVVFEIESIPFSEPQKRVNIH